MARGILATTAAIALALGVSLSAFTDQHGQGKPPHLAPSKAHATTTSPATTTTTTTKTTATTTLSPLQQKVASHTQLSNKLQSRLPMGTNVVNAAGGFRNLGQFVAAVNVSHNLGIPFTQLKADMVTKHMSLGQSIQALRPSADSTHEIERAQTQSRRMMDAGDK